MVIGAPHASAAPFDDAPQADPAFIQVDEANLGPIVVNSALTIDWGLDGPGGVLPNNYFTSDTPLYAAEDGNRITVYLLSGTTYSGQTNSDTIFNLSVYDDGSFSYTQLGAMQHPGDDPVNMTFGAAVSDFDGDSVIALIHVEVLGVVPEPASVSLLALAGLGLRRRRRR